MTRSALHRLFQRHEISRLGAQGRRSDPDRDVPPGQPHHLQLPSAASGSLRPGGLRLTHKRSGAGWRGGNDQGGHFSYALVL